MYVDVPCTPTRTLIAQHNTNVNRHVYIFCHYLTFLGHVRPPPPTGTPEQR